MKMAGVSGFRLLPLAALVLLASCGGGAKNATSPGDQQARSEQATMVAATVVAGGPTAIAAATANAAATQQAGGSALENPATATSIAATVIAGGPTAIARATAEALTATPGSGSPSAKPAPQAQVRLILSGPESLGAGETAELEIRLEGEVEPIAAFNFDIVYDQRLVTLDAPVPPVDALNIGDRQFQCSLPQPSGDIDPDPNVGRSRLICFSFGGESAPAPQTPLTLATVTLHGVSAGDATLTFENVAVFSPDAKGIAVHAPSKEINVR
jgi:hypothetical protein